jgi:hypothetical protein
MSLDSLEASYSNEHLQALYDKLNKNAANDENGNTSNTSRKKVYFDLLAFNTNEYIFH